MLSVYLGKHINGSINPSILYQMVSYKLKDALRQPSFGWNPCYFGFWKSVVNNTIVLILVSNSFWKPLENVGIKLLICNCILLYYEWRYNFELLQLLPWLHNICEKRVPIFVFELVIWPAYCSYVDMGQMKSAHYDSIGLISSFFPLCNGS